VHGPAKEVVEADFRLSGGTLAHKESGDTGQSGCLYVVRFTQSVIGGYKISDD
jgi:hypothetical protein